MVFQELYKLKKDSPNKLIDKISYGFNTKLSADALAAIRKASILYTNTVK